MPTVLKDITLAHLKKGASPSVERVACFRGKLNNPDNSAATSATIIVTLQPRKISLQQFCKEPQKSQKNSLCEEIYLSAGSSSP